MWPVMFLAIIVNILMLIRNNQVYDLRQELSHEEFVWVIAQPDKFTGYPTFLRYSSLPSYNSMLLHFWKPVSSYREALSPLESYYP